ncbi:LOW QUALITY PROTEIN: hypothetical protein TorRG33x02_291230 [Trema orientale]|uniref:Uncharacterized protein n=1 Tax=Trema orientale TaxID=63057 RepID=A0A2P5CBE9_TREOI|nr:LOW QUALITY PROTEIN: hypothetical protein TorRG33x02_291230 [Trema orientale]
MIIERWRMGGIIVGFCYGDDRFNSVRSSLEETSWLMSTWSNQKFERWREKFDKIQSSLNAPGNHAQQPEVGNRIHGIEKELESLLYREELY